MILSHRADNGQWVTWQIPIPNDYHCNDAIALGCWVKLQLVYPAGTTVSEITRWSAYIFGEPVLIVQRVALVGRPVR